MKSFLRWVCVEKKNNEQQFLKLFTIQQLFDRAKILKMDFDFQFEKISNRKNVTNVEDAFVSKSFSSFIMFCCFGFVF